MSERKLRRVETGVVTSDKMDKTITVKAETLVAHPIYKKRVRRYRIYKAHDQNNEARSGDLVEIMQARAMSKTKNWRLVRVIKKSEIFDINEGGS